jgi:hypothetical protein
MIQRLTHVHFKLLVQDFDSLFGEDLKSLGIDIRPNPSTYPYVDIEFYDEDEKVMNFLRVQAAQGNIIIYDVSPRIDSQNRNVIPEIKKGNELPKLTWFKKLVVKICRIPYPL